MRDLNHVSITGRMTADPEFKHTPSGKALAKFSMAVNRGNDRDGHPYPPYFFECEVWGKGAEVTNQHARKGKQMLVQGRLVQKKWVTGDGENRQRVGIEVDKFIFMGSKPDKKKPPSTPSAPVGEGPKPEINT